MLTIKKIKFGDFIIIEILFLIMFCDKVFASLIFRTMGPQSIRLTYIVLFNLLLFSYLMIGNHYKDIIVPFTVYYIVAMLFLLTYFIHPEYSIWFSHPSYGIVPMLLYPRCGLWAFLVVWLIKDERQLFKVLKFSAWITFIFYSLQFFAATQRGYWVDVDISGEIEQGRYNLEFGYDMLFSISFMGAYAFLGANRTYYLPYTLGLIMILLGGGARCSALDDFNVSDDASI